MVRDVIYLPAACACVATTRVSTLFARCTGVTCAFVNVHAATAETIETHWAHAGTFV